MQRSRAGRLAVLCGVVLMAGFVVLAAVAGQLYWERVTTRGEQAARATLATLAAREIPQVFGYDYQTVERSLTDVYPLLTPQYRQEFRKSVISEIIPAAKKREVVSQVTVVGSGVMNATRESGSVMVYINRTLTDKDRQPVYDGSRIRVDYKRIDGTWLIAYITPI